LNSFTRASAAVAAGTGFFYEITRADMSSLSIPTGIRAALVAITLPVLGLAVGQPRWVYATLAAIFVLNTEGPRPLPFLFASTS
jgi:hypothetical protein